MKINKENKDVRSGYKFYIIGVIILFFAVVYSLMSGSNSALRSTTSSANIDYQIIKMNVTSSGWQPDSFVLKKGIPVKWIIDGQQLTGCNNGIKVPSLGLSFTIKPGIQTIEFTPTQTGLIQWSCWMGMIKGKFTVNDDIISSNICNVDESSCKI